jgi:hypothetical protein
MGGRRVEQEMVLAQPVGPVVTLCCSAQLRRADPARLGHASKALTRRGEDGVRLGCPGLSRILRRAEERSRVNFFLNTFKKLRFIEYDGEMPLKINSSLLSVVLHD